MPPDKVRELYVMELAGYLEKRDGSPRAPSQVLVKLQLQMRPMDIHEVRIRCHGQLDWNLWCASNHIQVKILCLIRANQYMLWNYSLSPRALGTGMHSFLAMSWLGVR